MRIVLKTLLVVPVLILAYLFVVALWSWSSFDDAVASLPPLPPQALSSRQIEILLKVEDPTFFEHAGLSVAPGQGLATVSSAVARDLFLYQGKLEGINGAFQVFYRAVFDCCKKVDLGRDVTALVLNAKLSKDRQLAFYTANVYMGAHDGQQIRGFEQAAQSYFGKPVGIVTQAEFIQLVAMVKGPNMYHPVKHPALLEQRSARIAALVTGKCQPAGWLDTALKHCDQ